MMTRRLTDLTSLTILLGLSIITAVLWFASARAQAVADNWSNNSNDKEFVHRTI